MARSARWYLVRVSLAAGVGLLVWVGVRVGSWLDGRWTDGPPAELAPWRAGMSLRETFKTFPPGGPARVAVLTGNEEAWVARWELLAGARRRVEMSTFIFREDVFGLAFLGQLLRKAEAGVELRLLLDAQGTAMSRSLITEDYLDEVVATGRAEVRIYRPRTARFLQALLELDPTPAVASEHDKILVVDGRASIVGGRNIGAEYFADPRDDPAAFRDVEALVLGEGPARALVAALDAQYRSDSAEPVADEVVSLASQRDELLGACAAMEAWLAGAERPAAPFTVERWWGVLEAEHARLRGALRRARPPRFEAEARVLDSQPRRGSMGDAITEGLRRLVRSARREVLVETPYLVLSDAAIEELEAAARRGVQITIVTNGPTSTDNALSQALFLDQWPELLARVPGLRIYALGGQRNLHGKTFLFDGQVAVVSTYNLDPLSMAVNSEVAVVGWSDELTRAFSDPVRALIDRGAPVIHEYLIARDAAGRPLLDGEGRPRVEFGPEDHVPPGVLEELETLRQALRAAKKLTGLEPVL